MRHNGVRLARYSVGTTKIQAIFMSVALLSKRCMVISTYGIVIEGQAH